jgi:hypothetical protein
MKQKRQERVERRRPLVEINLAADSRRPSWPPRPKLSSANIKSSSLRRRGCGLLGSASILAVAAAAVFLGLR